jgi:hypothetical protein
MMDCMRLWRRRRRSRDPEGPEFQTGLVVLARDRRWRVCDATAGIPGPETGAPTIDGAAVADAFRRSWVRAQAGARRVRGLDEWVRAVANPGHETGDEHDQERRDGLAAAWQEFFLGGGVVFSVRTAEDEGITAVRCCWVWPTAGRELVHAGTRPADRLAITGADDWQPLARDRAAWLDAPMWTEAADWLAGRAAVDSRCSIWWAAGAGGTPERTVADAFEGHEALRDWWVGEARGEDAAAVARYGLGASAEHVWLRWDPRSSPRPDGLAAVLGFRRARDGVEVLWWDIGDDGAPSGPERAVGSGGAGWGIDEAEELALRAVLSPGRPTTVEWRAL